MLRNFCLFCLLLFNVCLLGESVTVIGIGSPCMDRIQPVDETFLNQIALKRGGWKQCDCQSFETIAQLASQKQTPTFITGGSTCNTMKGLAYLGISSAITGLVGNDEVAQALLKDLQDIGVKAMCGTCERPSTQIACLVTPDGERTFCALNETEQQIKPSDLSPSIFSGAKIAHVEGYRLINGYYIEKAMALAKQAGALVSFDLCNPDFGEIYRERVLALIGNYVDILFLDRDEAKALTKLPPEKAALFLKNYCDIVVVKLDEQGCLVVNHEESYHCSALATRVTDLTGAGDLYASGFLYAYLKGAPLRKCAKIGNLLGSMVIQHQGAQIPEPLWPDIHKRIALLLKE